MAKFKKLLAVIVLWMGFTVSAVAQIADAVFVPDTTFISLGDLAATYGLDRRHIEDTLIFQQHLDDWDTTFLARADYCAAYSRNVQRMLTSMTETCTERDGRVWYDSTVCIADYYEYCGLLAIFSNLLQHDIAYYRRREKQRLDELHREERLREQQLQREKDSEQMRIKQVIALQHEEIENACLVKDGMDKEKAKELKNLRYCYLPVYYKYDLSAVKATDQSLAQLRELEWFQRQLLDSVLGPVSFEARISSFADRLRERAGKGCIDVYKSYMRQCHATAVPVTFTTMEGYRLYTEQCRAVMRVQGQYMSAVDKREQIQSNVALLQDRCSRGHKNVFISYSSVLGDMELTPSFATETAGVHYLEYLDEVIFVQQKYMESVDRIDRIDARGDSIQLLCGRGLVDVAVSYRKLIGSVSFVPNFRTPQGSGFYNRALDDFERLQDFYCRSIVLRKSIAGYHDTLTHAKKTPAGFLATYRACYKQYTLTPAFSTADQANSFVVGLESLLSQQRQFLSIAEASGRITDNTVAIKSHSKEHPHNVKAYTRLADEYNLSLESADSVTLGRYQSRQQELLNIQRKVLQVISDPSKSAVCNSQLKDEKDLDRIRLSFGIVQKGITE